MKIVYTRYVLCTLTLAFLCHFGYSQRLVDIESLSSVKGASNEILIASSAELSKLESSDYELLESHSKEWHVIILKKDIAPQVKFYEIPNEAKVSPQFLEKVESEAFVDAAITFYEAKKDNAHKTLRENFGIVPDKGSLLGGKIILAQIPTNIIQEVLEVEGIAFLDIADEFMQIPLTQKAWKAQAVSPLNASGLTGEGVVIGVGDGGSHGSHLDFEDRVIDKAGGHYSSWGDHPDKVAGIIGGAGVINPSNAGIAPGATLITQKTSRVTTFAEEYVRDYNMSLANHSYGVSFACSSAGTYNYSSGLMDAQSFNNPTLLHVVAAGNSGGATCSPYPAKYYSILRAYASAKNVLTVGNINANGIISSTSSRGPVADGRIKPEVVAVGDGTISTNRSYGYSGFGGTSAAAPSATGTLALVHQRYKEIYNQDINTALSKALICNAADDMGNLGPDYTYGFGRVNAMKTIETLENGQFFENTMNKNGSPTKTHSIHIPAGVKQVKIMLYWHDKEAASYPIQALINDLDIELNTPNNDTYLPWVLDHVGAAVTNLATRQVDNLNNIEQITLDNPQEGSYDIKVKKTNLTTDQPYAIVYTFEYEKMELIYPQGGEVLDAGTTTTIAWQNDLTTSGNFKIEYSLDNGTSWTIANADFNTTNHLFDWNVPAIMSEHAQLKITDLVSGASTTSEVFSIITTPSNVQANNICNGYIAVSWDEISGINNYELYIISSERERIIPLQGNTYIYEASQEENDIWIALRAKTSSGKHSSRTIATRVQMSNTNNCPWANDIQISEVYTSKDVGRNETSIEFSQNENITISLKNAGNTPLSAIPLTLVVSGVEYNELVTQEILPNESLEYVFSTSFDFSTPREYPIDAWTSLSGDTHNTRDSFVNKLVVRNLANEKLTLPYQDAFTITEKTTVQGDEMGVANMDRVDFYSPNGGYAVLTPSSNGSEVEFKTDFNGVIVNEFVSTLNLADYTNQEVILSFDYEYTYGAGSTSNKIYARGNDTETWVAIYTIPYSASWTTIDTIQLARILADNGQALSSSSQVKFVQSGYYTYKINSIEVLSTGNALPVELTYFNARKEGKNVLLEWQTSSEINSEYFEVQVAKGEENLLVGNFEVLGKVRAQGESNEDITYYFNDIEHYKSGIRYYRLKQVDYDGTSEYFGVVSVDFNSEGEAPESKILPNILNEETQVQWYYNSTTDKEVTYQLFDSIGRHISGGTIQVLQGTNLIPINVENIGPNAYYHLVLEVGDDEIIHEKIIRNLK